MIKESAKVEIDSVDEHIIRTLAYYDIFNYPLKSEEVFLFLGTNHVDVPIISQKLFELSQIGLIFQFNEFYSLQNNKTLVDRRIQGNTQAEKLLALAKKQANLISSFPFVRAVMGSGSLSKNYMDEASDLDFFIVTTPGRLWIARMLLVAYKRLFLANQYKYFCINYFVDTKHLEIEEKNLFTATELATVLPLTGPEYYHQLCDANAWLKTFFPNYTPRSTTNIPLVKISIGKKIIEACIDIMFGNFIDRLCMKIFSNHLKKAHKHDDFTEADFEIAFKTKRHASKNHPHHYQQKVMKLYEQKLENVNVSLNSRLV